MMLTTTKVNRSLRSLLVPIFLPGSHPAKEGGQPGKKECTSDKSLNQGMCTHAKR